MTTTIKKDDFIQSIADGLQFISYYHPTDFIQANYSREAMTRKLAEIVDEAPDVFGRPMEQAIPASTGKAFAG